MPFWSRYPRGVYQRNTPDYWNHNRGRCSMQISAQATNWNVAFCLFNDSAPGVYLHILSIVVDEVGPEPGPWYGKTITGQPAAPPADGNFLTSPTVPIYSNDQMPPGVGIIGQDVGATFNDAFFIPRTFSGIFAIPQAEIAVLAPNDSFELYTDVVGNITTVVFDWVWLGD